MGLEIFESAGQAQRDGFAIARRTQIAGNPHHADDRASLAAHRQLGRQAPPGTAVGVPMQLEVIDDRTPGPHYHLILVRVDLRQFFWKNLAHMAADQFPFILAATSFDQRLIHREIAPPGVLHKKRGVRQMIEKLFDDREITGDYRGRFRQDLCECYRIRFHGLAVILRHLTEKEITKKQIFRMSQGIGTLH